jgi:hypothetical protein
MFAIVPRWRSRGWNLAIRANCKDSRAKTSAHRVAVHFRFASRCAGFEPSCSSVLQNPLYRGESRSSESKHFITRLMLGRGSGSNPAHGDAERVRVTTRCAEVFALPFWGLRARRGRFVLAPFHTTEKITEEAAGSGRLISRYKILLSENEQYDCMKKYFVIGLMALGLSAFIPQPAKAGVHFGIFVGPPAYYYPGYYPDYYYGYPYYYGPRYYHHYGYYRPWGYRHYHRWHHWD